MAVLSFVMVGQGRVVLKVLLIAEVPHDDWPYMKLIGPVVRLSFINNIRMLGQKA